ncbi:internal scaffolding protein [Microviridae sp.]|nr:internal scaffolding protein [Microviridae sp.]
MQRQPKKRPKISFKKSTSLTEQHHGETVKIHNIIKQHQTTGFVSHVASRPPQYADMVTAPDFYQAQCIIANASSMFEEIPAQIRKSFDNDPGQFLDFISNPENKQQMDELGIDSSHIPEDYEKPLSEDEKEQVHLEELIDSKLAQEAKISLSDATPEQLQAAINNHPSNKPPKDA